MEVLGAQLAAAIGNERDRLAVGFVVSDKPETALYPIGCGDQESADDGSRNQQDCGVT